MRRTLLAVSLVLLLSHVHADQSKTAPLKQSIEEPGSYKIIEVKFDKQIGWPEGISQVNSEGWRRINETYVVLKLDTVTGRTWMLETGMFKDKDGQLQTVTWWTEVAQLKTDEKTGTNRATPWGQ